MNFLFKRLGECTFWAQEFCLWENIILTREHWKMPQPLMNYSTELKFFWGVNMFIKLHGTYSNMFSLFGALSFSFFFFCHSLMSWGKTTFPERGRKNPCSTPKLNMLHSVTMVSGWQLSSGGTTNKQHQSWGSSFGSMKQLAKGTVGADTSLWYRVGCSTNRLISSWTLSRATMLIKVIDSFSTSNEHEMKWNVILYQPHPILVEVSIGQLGPHGKRDGFCLPHPN